MQEKDVRQSGFRTTQGRLSEPLLASLDRHRSDKIREKLHAVHAFDKAHLVMLIERGFVSRADGVKLLMALRGMEADGVLESRLAGGGGLHSGEYYLTSRLGPDLGGQVHLGRSSADLSGVSRRMLLRETLLDVLAKLNALRSAIAAMIPLHVGTVMPAYTHGQHAQPTTFAHWLAMWETVFARDHSRLRETLERVNRSPAGAAAVTGTDFDIDRPRVAHLLGFSGTLANTMDATLSNDVFIECMCGVALLAGNISRLSEDLLFWASHEASMISIPDRFCDTSSIMAQKRNPYVLHEMRALTVEAAAALNTAIGVEAGTTGQSVLARKLSEGAAWRTFATLGARLDEVVDLLPSMAIRADRMRELAEGNWSQATDVAGALVRECGLAWRQAHQVVAIMMRYCEEERLRPGDVTVGLVERAMREYGLEPRALDPGVLRDALSVDVFVRRRTLEGGPAPESVLADLASLRRQLDSDTEWLDAFVEGVKAGETALECAIDDILRAA